MFYAPLCSETTARSAASLIQGPFFLLHPGALFFFRPRRKKKRGPNRSPWQNIASFVKSPSPGQGIFSPRPGGESEGVGRTAPEDNKFALLLREKEMGGLTVPPKTKQLCIMLQKKKEMAGAACGRTRLREGSDIVCQIRAGISRCRSAASFPPSVPRGNPDGQWRSAPRRAGAACVL